MSVFFSNCLTVILNLNISKIIPIINTNITNNLNSMSHFIYRGELGKIKYSVKTGYSPYRIILYHFVNSFTVNYHNSYITRQLTNIFIIIRNFKFVVLFCQVLCSVVIFLLLGYFCIFSNEGTIVNTLIR